MLKSQQDYQTKFEDVVNKQYNEQMTQNVVFQAQLEEMQKKLTEDLAYMEKIMQRAFKKQQDSLDI